MTELEGLELRIAALTAAGWHLGVHPDTTIEKPLYSLVWPGVLYGERNLKGVYNNYFESKADAWSAAHAVESSVDAALQYLPLNDTDYWKLIGPCDGSYYVHIATETETTWISVAGKVDRQSFARAMCRAYLEYKSNR